MGIVTEQGAGSGVVGAAIDHDGVGVFFHCSSFDFSLVR